MSQPSKGPGPIKIVTRVGQQESSTDLAKIHRSPGLKLKIHGSPALNK